MNQLSSHSSRVLLAAFVVTLCVQSVFDPTCIASEAPTKPHIVVILAELSFWPTTWAMGRSRDRGMARRGAQEVRDPA